MISIILPTYNGKERIKNAIESVLSQSYKTWELLIIDDASFDNIKDVVEEFIQKDKRIFYFRNDQNLGIQKTLNKGLDLAKGEYIARIDYDDEWIDSDKIKNQIEFLEKNKEYVLIGTGVIAVDENGNQIFKTLNPKMDIDIRNSILNKTCFVHSSVVFKKEKALFLGGYSELENARHIEDYDLWLKLGTVGKLHNLPIYGVKLLIHSNSLSSKNKIIQFKNSIKLISNFKRFYPNYFFSKFKLTCRLFGYLVLNIWPMKILFSKVYKLYKNI